MISQREGNIFFKIAKESASFIKILKRCLFEGKITTNFYQHG
ncbi:hypothetical protein RU95_GL001325 [Enterococcus avium]|nr:hypothetical protein RU95_GL001325 [Enterococcus avium]